MIVDEESCTNEASTTFVEKLGLSLLKYPRPYKLEQLNECLVVKVNKASSMKLYYWEVY